jgi:hypothetical protein
MPQGFLPSSIGFEKVPSFASVPAEEDQIRGVMCLPEKLLLQI